MSAGPYNLRSRSQVPIALPADLNSPEHYPPLTTPPSPMATPSSNRDDAILEQLRLLSTTMAAHTARIEELALTNARVGRLEELVTSLTSTRTGGESTVPAPIITRTPQVPRVSVRRSLMPTVPEATTSRPLPTPTRSFISPPMTPEAVHAEIAEYELKAVMKIMKSNILKSLHYDGWLRFYRALTSALYACNAPEEYCNLFSLSAPQDYVPDALANKLAFHTLVQLCAEGEVLAAARQYESAHDGRGAFLKLHDLCNTTTLLSADVIRTQIQSFSIVDTKPPNV